MNEVSIIINGVRYDAVEYDGNNPCRDCDFKNLCIETDLNCEELIGSLRIFKKSDKKFEV